MKTEAISKLAMKALAYAFIALGTLACMQEQEAPVPTPDPAPGVGEAPFTPQRTEAQAKHLALAFLREQGGELRALSSTLAFETSVMTRSTARSLSQAVDSLDSASHPVDTLLYVLNLRNDRGCVLVSGDKRLPDIVAYLPQGHLDLKALPKHSGVSLFLESYPKYYSAEMERMSTPNSLYKRGRNGFCLPGARIQDPEIRSWRYRISEGEWEDIVKPLCPVTWSQEKPYNFRSPFTDPYQQALAGCVAVATAQLIASHRYPHHIDGDEHAWMNWELLCKYPTPYAIKREPLPKVDGEDSVAREQKEVEIVARKVIAYADQVSLLLNVIGYRLRNQWGTGATGACTKDIPVVLRSLGYTHPSELTGFSSWRIVKSLDNGSSVIMSGFNTASSNKVGHAWLCDGYKRRDVIVQEGYDEYAEPDECDQPIYGYERPPKELIRRVETRQVHEYEYLFHYNWGWKGECDGYFLSGVFSPNSMRNYSGQVENILDVKP